MSERDDVLAKLREISLQFTISQDRFRELQQKMSSLGYANDAEIQATITRLFVVEGRLHTERTKQGGKRWKRNLATGVRVESVDGTFTQVFPGDLGRENMSVEDVRQLGPLGMAIARAMDLEGVRRGRKLNRKK